MVRRSRLVKNKRVKPEPGKHPISAEAQPDDFLIAAFILGADGMMESFRRRAIEAWHSGVIPAEEKLRSLINERYSHPALDGTSIKELAERNFTAGAQAVVEVLAEQADLTDISVIRSMGRLRTNIGKFNRLSRGRDGENRASGAVIGPTLHLKSP
jgi:hypothetical protein